jgi:glycogen(starch) synthase
MRLLFLSNLYPPHGLGGYEQWCQEVATCLRQRGHAVQVLTSRHGIPSGTDHTDGVIRSLYLQADIHYYRPLDFFLKRPSQEQANARELRHAIGRFSPHLVVVWGMWNLSRNLPYWAEKWMPGRVAYYISSYWPLDTDIHEEYWELAARKPLVELVKRPLRTLALWQLHREGYPPQLRFQHAVCCSRYVRDTLAKAGKLPIDASVLLGGIETEPFMHTLSTSIGSQKSPLRLLFFGSLLSKKGIHTAIEAVGLLKGRGLLERVELTILGSGHPEYETRLRAMAAQMGIGNRVHFVSQVPRDEIPSWLARFDVFLFTSIWAEPMARTVMEAMAAGLLVIGTEVGGQVEMLIDGLNGLTFPAEDAIGLADRIVQVIDNPSLRRRLAQAGQQMVLKRFTLKRMVDEVEVWLESTLQ